MSLGAGVVAGSVALIGFGVDSAIEVPSALAARWRLGRDFDDATRERAELIAHRIIGWSLSPALNLSSGRHHARARSARRVSR